MSRPEKPRLFSIADTKACVAVNYVAQRLRGPFLRTQEKCSNRRLWPIASYKDCPSYLIATCEDSRYTVRLILDINELAIPLPCVSRSLHIKHQFMAYLDVNAQCKKIDEFLSRYPTNLTLNCDLFHHCSSQAIIHAHPVAWT